jgi:hypothetical protein
MKIVLNNNNAVNVATLGLSRSSLYAWRQKYRAIGQFQPATPGDLEDKREQANYHRIILDLDDGVKVNDGKFGNLLDSVKAVTGGVANE